jgi:hypothetical protein
MRLLLVALACAPFALAQQVQSAPDHSRDARSLFAFVGPQLVLVDLDGDGFDDAVSGPLVLATHLQRPQQGTWIDQALGAVSRFALAEFDGDGDPDLIATADSQSGTNGFVVLHNDGRVVLGRTRRSSSRPTAAASS